MVLRKTYLTLYFPESLYLSNLLKKELVEFNEYPFLSNFLLTVVIIDSFPLNFLSREKIAILHTKKPKKTVYV